jgi:hypothetical protein
LAAEANPAYCAFGDVELHFSDDSPPTSMDVSLTPSGRSIGCDTHVHRVPVGPDRILKVRSTLACPDSDVTSPTRKMPLGPFDAPVQSPLAAVFENANLLNQSLVLVTTYTADGASVTEDELTTLVLVVPSSRVAVTSALNAQRLGCAPSVCGNMPLITTLVVPLTVAVVAAAGSAAKKPQGTDGCEIGLTLTTVPFFAFSILSVTAVRTPAYTGDARIGAVTVSMGVATSSILEDGGSAIFWMPGCAFRDGDALAAAMRSAATAQQGVNGKRVCMAVGTEEERSRAGDKCVDH